MGPPLLQVIVIVSGTSMRNIVKSGLAFVLPRWHSW